MVHAGQPTSNVAGISRTEGLTVLEVLVAVVLFTVAVLVGGKFIVAFVHQVAISEVRAQATEFAIGEMERIRLLPYDDITPINTAPVPEAPEYTRSVAVTTVGADPASLYAYRLITVTVDPPGQMDPVSVTTAVAE